MKHIRGILFDDIEKSGGKRTNSKSQSIHLEIKPIKFLKPTSTTIATNKKSKLTQDDSAIPSKASTREVMVNDRVFPNKFDIVARPSINE